MYMYIPGYVYSDSRIHTSVCSTDDTRSSNRNIHNIHLRADGWIDLNKTYQMHLSDNGNYYIRKTNEYILLR